MSILPTHRAFLLVVLFSPACRPSAGITQATTAGSPAAGTPVTQTDSAKENPPVGVASPAASMGASPNTPASSSGASPATVANFVFSPYKDVAINFNYQTNLISTSVTGTNQPLLQAWPGARPVTWAFATGECGSETFGGISATQLAAANLPAWTAVNRPFIVSTGGAAGAFSCGSDANFTLFLKRYLGPNFLGVDFDIEAGQSQATIDALVARVQTAQNNPDFAHLRFSFTLATLAGSSPQSLGPAGLSVMQAIKAAGLTSYFINLMTMDYGSALATNCTLSAKGDCDMGASAVQAARNLHEQYGVAYSQIEITPMLGGNDTQGETFTLGDITTVVSFARAQGLGGLHVWSLDRDMDCMQAAASPTCNSYGQGGTLGFTNAFVKALQ